jgi:hypothetical protein
LWRFFNYQSGAHFYTASVVEKDNVVALWDYSSGKGPYAFEGSVGRVIPGSTAAGPDQIVVYRFFIPSLNAHFYSSDPVEVEHVKATWPDFYRYEGPAYVAYARSVDGKGCVVPGTVPLYRFFKNDNSTHFYTVSADERDAVIAKWDYDSGKGPYAFEGIAYCILPN